MTAINALTDVWNNVSTVFTGLQISVTNTSSAAGSKLFDFQLGGLSVFNYVASTRIYNIYDTFTDTNNYRGVFMGFDVANNNTFMITAQAAGTGAPAGPIRLSGKGGVYFWDPDLATGVAAGMGNVANKSFMWSDNFVVDFANSDTILSRGSAGVFKFVSANSFSANNTVATVLGSVGPVGSHTTVQNWLTIQDNGGNVRYIPCF